MDPPYYITRTLVCMVYIITAKRRPTSGVTARRRQSATRADARSVRADAVRFGARNQT